MDNNQDLVDSRDIIERIEELETEQDDMLDEDTEGTIEEWEADGNGEELDTLRELADECKGYASDWEYGESLIRDSYFKEYAQETAENTGMIPDTQSWPICCIDWDQAADELKMDYTSVDWDGVEYWIRAY